MVQSLDWLLGGLLGLIAVVKGLLIYIWVKHDTRLTEVRASQEDLFSKLMTNYLDKHETRDYIDKELASVQHSIDRLADVIVPLTAEIRKLNDKVLVLETKEQYNDRIGGS